MHTTLLLERTMMSRDCRVDRQIGVIRGVRVLGRSSANGRVYSDACLAAAKRLYESAVVNIDHPDKRTPDESRPVASRIGWLRNVVLDAGGLRADLHYLRSHPLAEQIVEAAERRPELLGLSHNAEGRAVRRNGTMLVEEIFRVRSVDLVCEPASTVSLFEQQDPDIPRNAKEFAKAIRTASPRAGAFSLRESGRRTGLPAGAEEFAKAIRTASPRAGATTLRESEPGRALPTTAKEFAKSIRR